VRQTLPEDDTWRRRQRQIVASRHDEAYSPVEPPDGRRASAITSTGGDEPVADEYSRIV
jgi:hypothetical protein